MTGRDSFVSRWSRLKRQSALRRKHETEQRKDIASSGAAVTNAIGEQREAAGTMAGATRTFDAASLPSIESITAGTDISGFLQLGVPAELAAAALRRAWVSDPVIRDFIGIAENQWDFTNPTAVPGFGPLPETSDARALVARAAGMLDDLRDEFSARKADGNASADMAGSAMAAPQHDDIEKASRDMQPASGTRAAEKG